MTTNKCTFLVLKTQKGVEQLVEPTDKRRRKTTIKYINIPRSKNTKGRVQQFVEKTDKRERPLKSIDIRSLWKR